jgi:3-keto-5-aminohexanoate cleavage enzyme
VRIEYKDIPDRGVIERITEFNFTGQKKWDIPEACPVKIAVVGRPPNRKGSPVPNIPMQVPTPDQMKAIVEQSMACVEAGACIVHYHAVGKTAKDWEEQWRLFAEPILKHYPDVAFDLSILTRTSWEDEAYLIKAFGDICDSTPCNMSLLGKVQNKKLIQAEVQMCQDYGIVPEMACYVEGDIDVAKDAVVDTGIAKKPMAWDLLPSYWVGGTPMYDFEATAFSLMNMVHQIKLIEPESEIMLTASGRASSHLMALSIMMGLSVKCGEEDTYYWYPNKDDVLDDNVRHVKETVEMIKILGRRPATANEYRQMTGRKLKKTSKK